VREGAIQRGFAWAASSYRANGFNPQGGAEDTLLLIDEFKKNARRPEPVDRSTAARRSQPPLVI
jgi:hypothetical protein